MAEAHTSPQKIKNALYMVNNSPSIQDFADLEPDRDDTVDLYGSDALDKNDVLSGFHSGAGSSTVGISEIDLSALTFADGDDDPFGGTVDPADFMNEVRRPTTTFEDSDDSDQFDEHAYQDEGLRRQLRITLRRRLNYGRYGSSSMGSSVGEMIASPSSEARRFAMGADFKNLHQEVANRLSLEVFESNVAVTAGARSHSVPEFAKRRSHGRLSILPDSIKADEIGCNLLRHRRIRTANSKFLNEIVDPNSIMNGLEKSFTKIDLLDIESVIEEESTRRRRLFKKRRRQTRELSEPSESPPLPIRGPPSTLSHISFVPSEDKKLSEAPQSYQLPVYTPVKSKRVDITNLMPGDLLFIFDCVTTHSEELNDRPSATVKHVMIVTDRLAVNLEVAHVTRSCSEQSFLKAWEDPETEKELMSRQSIFRMMSDIPEAINHMAAGYLGMAFRPCNPIVKMNDGSTQDVGIVAGQIASAMIKTGRVIPSRSVVKASCLAEASDESFLLKNKYSFYRRNIRDIWDKGDVFLNLFPEDFVVLCYHRAIVKCCKSFDKELIQLLDVDWRACNIHDLYNFIVASEDWWTPGEVLFEFF